MGPKTKKKQTKKEKLEAQKRAEEAAKQAEEERLRLEEEKRRLEEEESKRKEALRYKNLVEEQTRVASEKESRENALAIATKVKTATVNETKSALEWQRYLACKRTPNPQVLSELNDFWNKTNQRPVSKLDDALQMFELVSDVIEECLDLSNEDNATNSSFLHEAQRMRDLLAEKQNQLTSHLLQFYKEHTTDASIIDGSSLRFGYGLWLNLERSSRQRRLNFQNLDLIIEVPKQVASSPLCLVVKEHRFRDLPFQCKTGYQSLGPLLEVQLLGALPPNKDLGGWSIRQVLNFEQSFTLMEYPSCLHANRSEMNQHFETNMSPFVITISKTRYWKVLKNEEKSKCAELIIGRWNSSQQQWSIEDISEICHDSKTNCISFSVTQLGVFSCVLPMNYWLPYRSWFLCPVHQDQKKSIQLRLEIQNGNLLVFEIDNGKVTLKEPYLDEIEASSPGRLIKLMREIGLCVVPSDGTNFTESCSQKDCESEKLFCRDIGHICGSFCIANSKWNKCLTSDKELLCQISEIEDIDKTTVATLPASYEASKAELFKNDQKAVSLLRRGTRGVAFVKNQEHCIEYEDPLEYDSEEYANTNYGKLHFDSIALLQYEIAPCVDAEKEHLKFSEATMTSLLDANLVLSETVSDLLFALRIFSLG